MPFTENMHYEYIKLHSNNKAFKDVDDVVKKRLNTFPYDKKYNLVYTASIFMSYVNIKYTDE